MSALTLPSDAIEAAPWWPKAKAGGWELGVRLGGGDVGQLVHFDVGNVEKGAEAWPLEKMVAHLAALGIAPRVVEMSLTIEDQ